MATALFTCSSLLPVALEAARAANIPRQRIFLVDRSQSKENAALQSIDDLVLAGSKLAKVEPLTLNPGQGAQQVAFLCYSSGTSGLPVDELEPSYRCEC